MQFKATLTALLASVVSTSAMPKPQDFPDQGFSDVTITRYTGHNCDSQAKSFILEYGPNSPIDEVGSLELSRELKDNEHLDIKGGAGGGLIDTDACSNTIFSVTGGSGCIHIPGDQVAGCMRLFKD